MATRRDFLKAGAIAGAGALLAKGATQKAVAAPGGGGSPNVTKFVDRIVHPIPKLTPTANSAFPGADYYELTMSAGTHRFHRQFLALANTFRYGAMPYLGPTIEAQAGTPVVVKFINNLPITDAAHPLAASIDPTVPDSAMYPSLAPGRATPHLHGGFTAPQFDGLPHSWFTQNGLHGRHYGTLDNSCLPNEAVYRYENLQPAAPLWYHDHAMGITRLNVYAGLAGLYLVRDAVEAGLNLPSGDYEVPLVIQDKQFGPTGLQFYPTTSGVPAPYPHPIWVPEFFGDTPVVNAVAYPFLDVEPRRYRLRLYNGSQARFYNFKFVSPAGNMPFWVIGMEQGLLPAPVMKTTLLLAPGERADVIIDFAGLALGTLVTLKNDAKAPYPGGRGGGVPQIMQFKVINALVGTDTTTPPASLRLPVVPRLIVTGTAPMREIVMKETFDPATGVPTDVKLNGQWYDEAGVPIDETPKLNDNEIWQFINLTVDAHPMHLHLVKFQVVDRLPFNVAAYTTAWLAWVAAGRNPATKPVLTTFVIGPAILPPPEEMGWKDTVKAYPGQITRIIATFEVPPGTTLPAEYVYHCHILEHEENEMMRPFAVTATGSLPKKSGEEEVASEQPAKFALDQNYPNPFNPETTIRFQLPKDSPVQLKVFNTAGQEVATLAEGPFAAGVHTVRFNGSHLASGMYYAKITAGNFSAVQKMLLLK
jgi:spore coat protein A, manganese oxidase